MLDVSRKDPLAIYHLTSTTYSLSTIFPRSTQCKVGATVTGKFKGTNISHLTTLLRNRCILAIGIVLRRYVRKTKELYVWNAGQIKVQRQRKIFPQA